MIVGLVNQSSKMVKPMLKKRSLNLTVLLGEIGHSDGEVEENGERTSVLHIIAVRAAMTGLRPSCWLGRRFQWVILTDLKLVESAKVVRGF